MNVLVTKDFKACRNGEIYPTTIQKGEVVDGRLAVAAKDLDCGKNTKKAVTGPLDDAAVEGDAGEEASDDTDDAQTEETGATEDQADA